MSNNSNNTKTATNKDEPVEPVGMVGMVGIAEIAGAANSTAKPRYEGIKEFIYAGPSLPQGKLKEYSVFLGTFAEVAEYLKGTLSEFPEAEKLIVPRTRLAEISAKTKTPGNITNKYYNDIVSAVNKETKETKGEE